MSEKQVKEPRASYAVKKVLREVLQDPDAGLESRPAFEERLRRAEEYVASGGRLLSMEELRGE